MIIEIIFRMLQYIPVGPFIGMIGDVEVNDMSGYMCLAYQSVGADSPWCSATASSWEDFRTLAKFMKDSQRGSGLPSANHWLTWALGLTLTGSTHCFGSFVIIMSESINYHITKPQTSRLRKCNVLVFHIYRSVYISRSRIRICDIMNCSCL